MTTFCSTVGPTDSCDATVLQRMGDGLAKRGVTLTAVTHHAVVPSQSVAKNFSFREGIAMAAPRPTDPPESLPQQSLSSIALEGPSDTESPTDAPPPKRQRLAVGPADLNQQIYNGGAEGYKVLLDCCEDADEDTVTTGEESPLTAPGFVWTTVQVGETLVLDGACAALTKGAL